jgi:hypothetical protein
VLAADDRLPRYLRFLGELALAECDTLAYLEQPRRLDPFFHWHRASHPGPHLGVWQLLYMRSTTLVKQKGDNGPNVVYADRY